jgi:glycine C-acetyltransferase
MNAVFERKLTADLDALKEAGTYKRLRHLTTPMAAEANMEEAGDVIVLSSNNYLGLADDPEVVAAGVAGLQKYGAGTASVRFICGTFDIHRTLEEKIAAFLGTEAALTYVSCWTANEGLLPTVGTAGNTLISDELNHASIIDGIRLSKAKRFRYKHNDLGDLRARLAEADAAGARFKLVFTDGVFSMDGTIARLDEIRAICDEFGALLGIDECHASGFLGARGRGTPEYRGVFGKIDIITGTLGKALGGASGGFTSAKADVVALLRQRSRPYLFSNTIAPSIVGASLAVLDLLEAGTELRDRLETNTKLFRSGLTALGFDIKPGEHPIIPVMVYDAEKAQQLAQTLLDHGVYVIGFFYPVVPKGQARIRVQISALHTEDQLHRALKAFDAAGRELGIIP